MMNKLKAFAVVIAEIVVVIWLLERLNPPWPILLLLFVLAWKHEPKIAKLLRGDT